MQTLHNGDWIDKVATAEHANDVRVEVFQRDLLDHILAATLTFFLQEQQKSVKIVGAKNEWHICTY